MMVENFLRFSILSFAICYAAGECLESAQYQCMTPVNADAELHWSVFGTRVDFALAVHTSGFVALGFTTTPGTMYDTEVVAAVESSTPGVLSAETYRIDDFRGVTADPNINVYDAEVEVEVAEGITTLRFSRDADNGGAYTLNLDGPNDLVWSYHIEDTTIGYHGETRGALVLDLSLSPSQPVCLESDQQHQCMSPVNADAELHWSVFGTRVDFALAVHTSGFVALGFTMTPGTMYDTEVVAAVESSSGVLSAETYRIDDFRGVTADSSINVYDTEVEVEVEEGVTTTILRFSRDADNGGAYTLNLDGPNDLVWSYHIADPTIGYHGETRGALVLDLSLSPSQPVCLESDQQHQCMSPVNADAELHWSVFGTRVDFALAVHTSGFVALGFTMTPGTMYDTEVVAAVESSSGVLSAETYRIDDFRGVTADSSINVYDTEVEVEVEEGVTTTILRFSRDADNGGAYTLNLDGPNDLVWSYHIADPTIGYHGETRGALVLDLSLAPAPPQFTQDRYRFTFIGGRRIVGEVVGAVVATSEDGGAISYSLNRSKYEIDSNGVITAVKRQRPGRYRMEVEACGDGGCSTANVKLVILEKNGCLEDFCPPLE